MTRPSPREQVGHALACPSGEKPCDCRSSPRAPLSLGRAHLRLVHAEVVGNLMPHCIGDHLRQPLRRVRQAFVGTLKNHDAVWHGERLEHAAAGERAALVEPEQRAPARHPAARQLLRRRLGLHHQGHVLHPPAKPRRNARERLSHQTVEIVRTHEPSPPPVILLVWAIAIRNAWWWPSTAPPEPARVPSPGAWPTGWVSPTSIPAPCTARWPCGRSARASTSPTTTAWSSWRWPRTLSFLPAASASTAKTSPTPSAHPRSRMAHPGWR